MKATVTLNVEDYVYQFYQIGATALEVSVEEAMEQALFMYAGLVANDINQTSHSFVNLSHKEKERPQ